MRKSPLVVILATLAWSLSMHWWEGELMWSSHSPAFEPIRMIGVVDAWRHGIWDARWLPRFDQGYGYPIFSYHAPLFSWIGAAFLVLTGKPVLALRLTVMLFFIVGGLGCRTMAASFWARPGTQDTEAGDLAFIGWASATYLFTNIFVRGSLAEFAASAFFPWLLWGMWLITAEGDRFAAGAGVIAVSLALLILTHNAVALYAVMLLVTVLPILFRPAGWRGWAAWAAGGVMAICLTAFFVIPFLVEREFVRFDNIAFTDFKDHFIQLGHLFSIASWNPGTSGYGVSKTMPRHQGFLLPFALTGGAIALGIFKDGRLRRKTLILFALSVLTLGMTMTPSALLWENVRALQLTQFPWRWLSLNATVLALLVPALGLATRFRRIYLGGAATVLLLNVGLYGGPGPQWRRWEFDANPEWIRAGKNRTAVDDEYGPVWRDTVSFHPIPASSPPWRWHVSARQEEREIVAGVNYFPGWKAYWLPDSSAAAAEVPVEYSKTGLIQVRLPAGSSGQVELRFTNTPVRLAMKIFSGVSVMAFLALALWIRKRQPSV